MSSPYDRTSVNRRCAFPLRVTLEAAGPLQSVVAIDVNVGRKRMLAFLRSETFCMRYDQIVLNFLGNFL